MFTFEGKLSQTNAISLLKESGNLQHFNSAFVEMWKGTKNYREWRHHLRTVDSATCETLCHVAPRHPFAGTGHMSVTDVKLHLSNTITNTEGGKRVTQAVASTGRQVATAHIYLRASMLGI